MTAWLMACIQPLFALDPTRTLTQYMVEYWQADKGLPHSSIHCIAQSQDGYLWLGTEAGFARFDGLSFTVFDRQSTPEVLNNFIYRFATTPDGTLWAGTRGGGLIRYRDGKFSNYTKKNGLSDDHIYALAAGRDGSVWMGTREGGINHLKNDRITNLSTNNGLSGNYILAIYEDRQGTIWAGTYNSTIDRIKDGVVTTYHSVGQIRAFGEDKNGRLLAGGDGTGLLAFKDNQFTRMLSDDDVNGNVMAMYLDPDGSLWLGTQSGAFGSFCRYRNGRVEALTSQAGLSTDDITSIYQDTEGSLWVGTATGGLNHIKDGKFATLGMREGLSYEDVLCVREGLDNSLWIGTRSGLNHYKNGKFVTYGIDGVATGMTTIVQDRDGSVWFGSVIKGLYHIKNDQLTHYTEATGLTDRDVWAVNQTRDGSIWVGARDGLFQIRNEQVVAKYTKTDGLSDDQIRSVIEDRHGALWIGTQGSGLNRFKDGAFKHYGRKQGLMENAIRCLYEDREGCIWIGTRDGGLIRMKDEKFIHYNTTNGLPNDSIISVLEDDSGSLWVGASKGIFKLNKQELEQAALNPGQLLHAISYGEMDGMRSSECTGGYMTASCRTHDGRLYFATKKGVAYVHPERLKISSRPPPVRMEGVEIDHKPIKFESAYQIPPGNGDIEFKYTALALLHPGRVKFRYQLEGFDRGWIVAGNRRSAFYTNLRPGKYRFHVSACNEDGAWNQAGATFAFELLPHFYQTLWFAGMCAFSIALVGFAGHRIRVLQVKAREIELEGLVKERTKELREEISERRRGEEALRESEKRFRTLASHAPVGIFMTDTLGDYLFVNEKWCEMAGLNADEARGREWCQAVHPEDRKRVVEAWYRAIRTGEPYATEYRFSNRRGTVTNLSASAVTLHNHKGGIIGFLGTVTDITDLKRAEESLLHQQALLTNVIAHIPCGVFWKDTQSVYLGCNHTFAQTVGVPSPNEVIGRTDHQLPCSKEEADWFLKCDQEVMGSDRPMLNVEEPLRLPDGKHSVVLTSKVPLHDQDGRVSGILGIFTDIGDQKKFQEALRGLPHHIIEAQETERRRVARELHDGVIQLLSTAKFRMQSLNGPIIAGAPPGPALATPDTLLDKAIQEIRRISRNLRPSELDDLGLVPAVRSLCQEFKQRTVMEVDFECEAPQERLSPEMDLALYRIVQEALTNIEKHSEASRVRVGLLIKPDVIKLVIRDNGKGFDPAQGSIHYGRETCMGLVDMKERAAFVAGSLVINSQPGEGTEVTVLIPLRKSE